jgi:tripartite-type tricarboxylate transporter receptor subunit TctC
MRARPWFSSADTRSRWRCLCSREMAWQFGRAESYPDRTVKIIVPFAGRRHRRRDPAIRRDWLSRKWGQPVVIENRTGAAGNIGADFVYHSRARRLHACFRRRRRRW